MIGCRLPAALILMKKLLLIGLLCLGYSGFGQMIFLETFTNVDGTIVGVDDIGGVAWIADCNYCDPLAPTTDYNQVQGNLLENRDSNGPAYWTTSDIDISTCTEGITISLDIAEIGTLEGLGVTCAGGCAATDLIKLEVSYDSGTSWFAFSDAINGTTSTADIACDCGGCGAPTTTYPVVWCGDVVTGPTIATDDFTSNTFNDCVSVGISNTLQIRTTTMVWAGSEYIQIDNVSLTCTNCALPVEVGSFDAERVENRVNLNWKTLSETNNKKFNIQRSTDGQIFEKIGSVKGNMNSMNQIEYNFVDDAPLNRSTVYYRLEQVDLNGKKKYSEVKRVNYREADIYFDGSNIQLSFDEKENRTYNLNIYNLSGQLVNSQTAHNNTAFKWSESGFYIVEIPEINYRKKILVP